MKLRADFEPIRASLIHRGITDLDSVVIELIREETRLKSQSHIDHPIADSAFVVGRSSLSSRPQFSAPPSGDLICHHCHESGHVQIHCKKRNYFNYCKKTGHIVLKCPPLVKRGKVRYPTYAMSSRTSSSAVRVSSKPSGAAFVVSDMPHAQPEVSSGGHNVSLSSDFVKKLVQEALQEALPQALTSAFATGAFSGTSAKWLLDSGAFNHMTHVCHTFDKLEPVSTLHLRVANGDQIPVVGRGTSSTGSITLPNTLYVPSLLPNLVSVGQLAETGCDVKFNSTGCVV
ncbi:unnamed protein product [Linum trigynum]|uniref:Retrovirus-related Pol polyprotein from transposon TNT 1-94-like beta-barrel domain-containing protein n=1 Tax=Linum trigynum TaxID=586398 RepID=A0AAV2GNK0_9ROSI